MNPEKQRIKIGEAVGWEGPFVNEWLREYTREGGDVHAFCGTDPEKDRAPVPDYLNDLNAMHEAMMSQTVEFRIRFRKELQYIIAPETKPSTGRVKVSGACLMGETEYDSWFFATAAQRAEAFLKTLGLWEGEE